ncbi:MAG: hypothetical protein ACREOO_24020 [bacterium]
MKLGVSSGKIVKTDMDQSQGNDQSLICTKGNSI